MIIRVFYGLLIVFLSGETCIRFIRAGARCPAHWIKIGSNCYRTRYNYAVKNWTDARFWCQTQDADLAKFETITEQDEVRSYQGLLAPSTSFWIGLHKMKDEWKWADNSTVNSKIIQQINRAIIPGNDCGQLSTTILQSGECSQTRGVLCQQPAGKQIRCDTQNDWQSYGDTCYYRAPQSTSWTEARDFCQGRQSIMATPTTKYQQFALFDFIKNNAKKLWIGFHSIRNGNNFQWSSSDDKANPPLTFWENESTVLSSTDSQNMCAYMDAQGTEWDKSWKSASCDITSGGVICERPADIVKYNLRYYKTPKTWFQASATCALHNGQLATRNDTFLFDTNAWIGGSGINTTTTIKAPSGGDSEANDFNAGIYYDLCPCATDTGFVYLSCEQNRTFVCNTTSTIVVADVKSTASPGVVAVAILLVVFVLLVVLVVVIWMRRKKKKEDHIRFNGVTKSNGITITDIDSKEIRENEDNNLKTRPDSTYDHTTTAAKTTTDTNSNQNLYDHCVKRQNSTYDHTVRDNQSSAPADYGCVDDGQYKSVKRNGCDNANLQSDYNHI